MKVKNKKTEKPIDKVTVVNLYLALRICKISIPIDVVDRIIDLVELIEDKGDDTSIRDICELQAEWEILDNINNNNR